MSSTQLRTYTGIEYILYMYNLGTAPNVQNWPGFTGIHELKLVFISLNLFYGYYVDFDWCRKVPDACTRAGRPARHPPRGRADACARREHFS